MNLIILSALFWLKIFRNIFEGCYCYLNIKIINYNNENRNIDHNIDIINTTASIATISITNITSTLPSITPITK